MGQGLSAPDLGPWQPSARPWAQPLTFPGSVASCVLRGFQEEVAGLQLTLLMSLSPRRCLLASFSFLRGSSSEASSGLSKSFRWVGGVRSPGSCLESAWSFWGWVSGWGTLVGPSR